MYRQPDTTRRCPMCSATDLTPPTRFKPNDAMVTLDISFQHRIAPESIWTSNLESFRADRARVCLACGHVSLELSPGQLQKLREKLASIEPAA